MAERIIDRLEQIEIEQENGESIAVTSQASQSLFHFFHQGSAIGDVGQCVMAGHVGDLRFGSFLRRDILMDADPSSILHRLIIERKYPSVMQFGLSIVGLRPSCHFQSLFNERVGIPRDISCRYTSFKYGTQRRARFSLIVRKTIHVAIALIT